MEKALDRFDRQTVQPLREDVKRHDDHLATLHDKQAVQAQDSALLGQKIDGMNATLASLGGWAKWILGFLVPGAIALILLGIKAWFEQ